MLVDDKKNARMYICWCTGYTVNNPSLSMAAQLVSGALAGAVGQTSSYPLDIVRRRMQTSAISDAHYRTIYSTIVKIYTWVFVTWFLFLSLPVSHIFLFGFVCVFFQYREGGIMAFFKGLSMNWVKGPVSASISFATHDAIRDVLRKFLCWLPNRLKTSFQNEIVCDFVKVNFNSFILLIIDLIFRIN